MSPGISRNLRNVSRPTVLRISLCLALVVLGVVLAFALRLPGHLVLDTGPGQAPLGALTSRTSYIQELELSGPMRVSSVGVLLATWGRPSNLTHDKIAVYSDQGDELASLDLPPGSVKDNTYAEVGLRTPLSVGAKGRLFVVLSSTDGSTAESITAWLTKARVEGRLYAVPSSAESPLEAVVSGKRLSDALCVQVVGLGPNGLRAEQALRVAALLVCVGMAAIVWWAGALRRWWMTRRPSSPAHDGKRRLPWRSRVNIPNVYLVVALVWGLILVFLTPPLQTFDELAHYYRSWSVAQGQVVVPSSARVELPSGAEALTGLFPTGPLAFRLQQVDPETLLRALTQPMGSDWVVSSSSASSYGPVGYLPQAAGIDLIRLVNGSPLMALYLARLLNLAAAVLLTYAGLRLLPFARLGVCLIALLPMTVMEMASLSADALLIGGAIFFIGLVIRCTTCERVSRRDIVLLVLSAALLLNAKPGYASLSLLLLLLLPRQFSTRLAYALTVFGSILVTSTLTLLVMLTAPDASEFLAAFLGSDNHVDGMAQLRFVLAHPFAFIGAVGTTFSAQGVFLLRQTIAAYAWGQRNIGDGLVLLVAIGVGAVLTATESVSFALWRRAATLSVALLTALAVALGLYMGWSAVGAQEIAGLQGRYFLPCYALAFIGLAGFPFRKRWLVPAVVGSVVVILIIVNLYTLTTYYY